MNFHKDQIKPLPQVHHIIIPEKGKFIGHTNIACLQIYIGSGILEFFAADRKNLIRITKWTSFWEQQW